MDATNIITKMKKIILDTNFLMIQEVDIFSEIERCWYLGHHAVRPDLFKRRDFENLDQTSEEPAADARASR